MRRLITAMTLAAAMTLVIAPAALAGNQSDEATKDAAGWACGAEAGFPSGHCISPGTAKNFAKIAARGQTFQIMVFNEDGDFLTSEIATFKDSADTRSCPNDPESDDGTYWSPGPGIWVCHHQPG